MKALITLVLVLIAVWVPAGCENVSDADPDLHTESHSSFAPLDDVRLLANGLLQLGQSLRDFVQKTKTQINDIVHKLNIFDRSFYQLSVLTSEIKEEEEELRKTTVVLKTKNEEIRSMSVEINSKVETILEDRTQLQSKLEVLEEKLSSLSQGLVSSQQVAQISGLKEVIHTQERSITELLRAVREQSEQLGQQRMKIRTLEEKFSGNTAAQETLERMPEVFDTAEPTLTLSPISNSTTKASIADLPPDCSELFNSGERVSGVYAIRPNGSEPFLVFCEMSKDYGATVIQRRKDGDVNFDQTWEKYENGFGDLRGEFWLGLRKIHVLADQGNSVLDIQLEDWKRDKSFIKYSFQLQGPESNYVIHLTHQSGDLPDPMSNNTGMMFSTKDRDNDNHLEFNCAQSYTGGWWFNACGDTNLNGKYFPLRLKGRADRKRGIQWKPGRRTSHSLRFTQISIYPAAAATPAAFLSPTSTDTSESDVIL